MPKMGLLDRILLLLTGLLAAYQVVTGIDGKVPLAMLAYTIAFGVLLIAGLLILILGFDILENDLVTILATLIPLGLSVGLVVEYLPRFQIPYLIFAVLGFLVVVFSRLLISSKPATIALALVHGVSGMLIFSLPVYLSIIEQTPPGFSLVGVGGGLIGIAGLLLSFLKTGYPILNRQMILQILPFVLLLTTTAFVVGFWLA